MGMGATVEVVEDLSTISVRVATGSIIILAVGGREMWYEKEEYGLCEILSL